mgnify:CR=1 FL=1
MFSESKVTEIYCMADDFCKEFALQQEKYMIEDKKIRHRNKPNRMSDAEIMVILILFHSGGFRCFKHYYKEYVCKHLEHLFPRQVSYNRFVELEKEVLLPMTIFIKKVLLEHVPASVSSTPLLYVSAVTKESLSIRHLKDLPSVENVLWDGSLDSSCI